MSLDLLNHQAGSTQSPRRWLAFLGVAIVGLAGTGWGLWQFRAAQMREAQTEVSVAPEITTVTALGRLEPAGEMINLTASTSIQASRIEKLLVEEGDRVQTGQIIAILDNRDRLQASLQKAENQVRVAQAKLAQVKAGAKTGELQAQRAEIARLQADRTGSLAAQRAAVERLEAEVQNARLEYERYESLYQQGAVSASQRDAKRLAYITAQQQVQQAQAELGRIETTSQEQIQQAQATLDRLAEVRPVDLEAAEAEVQSAKATVVEAQANLEQAEVRSPRAGQIIKIHTYPGEKIADQGIVTLGQTQQMKAIAEVYQSDILKVQEGQPATITSPVIPNSLQGTVERIGLQVEQQQVVDEDPAANIDAKVVEVHIRLDPNSSQNVARLSNLQVTVTIQTE
ncbi:auxiliary transport protein, MFP family, putative [Coleofasciculus chthonoplastes PCC 7420]|uniref:Auxiliary transport protein, MFP family, putative n=1 Tax=Coleofasciculus chthonoplastes PCC 7420 TaxID=118168 RepID=B4VXB2_9CYAN|nr:ABC exporter membrane fusion protein [Coleofasciculus chthonoplastes]EDX73292.1 auxiliary transport protein, MFP family, putative [Coleofasciculus chthonoplastes PCC 7420]